MNRFALRPGFSSETGVWRIVAIGLALLMAAAGAKAAERSEPDAALVERVKDAVIKELRDSGALERDIDAGIKRYVERQRAEAAQRQQRSTDVRAAAVRPVTTGRDHVSAVTMSVPRHSGKQHARGAEAYNGKTSGTRQRVSYIVESGCATACQVGSSIDLHQRGSVFWMLGWPP